MLSFDRVCGGKIQVLAMGFVDRVLHRPAQPVFHENVQKVADGHLMSTQNTTKLLQRVTSRRLNKPVRRLNIVCNVTV